jgi:hypothetical protein
MYNPDLPEALKLEKAGYATDVALAAYSVECNAVKRGAEKVSNQTFGIWLKRVRANVEFLEAHDLPIHGT